MTLYQFLYIKQHTLHLDIVKRDLDMSSTHSFQELRKPREETLKLENHDTILRLANINFIIIRCPKRAINVCESVKQACPGAGLLFALRYSSRAMMHWI